MRLTRLLRCSNFRSLVYASYGDPTKVLTLNEDPGETALVPKDNQVLIGTLAAPVNPADINMIQGVYPIKPSLPAVGGNEGVAEVIEVGSQVRHLAKGDWVIPALAGSGTWISHKICSPSEVVKIPSDLPLDAAATLLVNPATAYRMLHDFVPLSPGDTFIQNGANSGVGIAAIQIGRALGLHSINVVRDRPDLDGLRKDLKSLGADIVLSEEELRYSSNRSTISARAPKLALNCVGGKSTLHLAASLANDGCLVTYGGMSRQPLQIPTGPLIFKDISLRGYWMSRWYQEHQAAPHKRDTMIEQLVAVIKRGELVAPPMKHVPVDQFSSAISDTLAGKGKQLIVF